MDSFNASPRVRAIEKARQKLALCKSLEDLALADHRRTILYWRVLLPILLLVNLLLRPEIAQVVFVDLVGIFSFVRYFPGILLSHKQQHRCCQRIAKHYVEVLATYGQPVLIAHSIEEELFSNDVEWFSSEVAITKSWIVFPFNLDEGKNFLISKSEGIEITCPKEVITRVYEGDLFIRCPTKSKDYIKLESLTGQNFDERISTLANMLVGSYVTWKDDLDKCFEVEEESLTVEEIIM